MEELKSESTSGDGAEAAPAARKFPLPALSRKMVIIVLAALAGIGLLAGGVAGYVSHVKSKQAAALIKKKAAAEEIRQAEENAKLKAESELIGEEARRAHAAVMSGTVMPPAGAADANHVTPVAEEAKPDAPLPERKAMLVPPEKPEPSPLATPAAAPQVPEEKKRAADAAAERPADGRAAVPSASGACALSGKSPEDYGKALSGCLEEFSRLEGRGKP